jgi:hypothetical protein
MTLWDGRRYCQGCVRAASLRLFDVAQSHPKLEETAPFDRVAQWRNALRMEVVVVAVFAILLGISGYSQWGPVGVLYGIGGALILCSIQAAIQLPAFVWYGRRMLPTVVVEDGRIDCFRGGDRKWGCQSLPLEAVRWRIGRSKQDTALRNTFIQRQQVVLLMLPRRAGPFSLGYDRYACGWSPLTMEIWTAFLTLAKVPNATEGNGRAARKMAKANAS